MIGNSASTLACGPPSSVATSEDGLHRSLSYEKWNAFYSFYQGKLISYGLYDTSTGPITYSKPALAPSK